MTRFRNEYKAEGEKPATGILRRVFHCGGLKDATQYTGEIIGRKKYLLRNWRAWEKDSIQRSVSLARIIPLESINYDLFRPCSLLDVSTKSTQEDNFFERDVRREIVFRCLIKEDCLTFGCPLNYNRWMIIIINNYLDGKE